MVRRPNLDGQHGNQAKTQAWHPHTKEERVELYRRAWGPGWPDYCAPRNSEGWRTQQKGCDSVATQSAPLTAVNDVFRRDLEGIAACSRLIREGLAQRADLSDVEQAIQARSPACIHPCIEKDSLRRIGIAASDSVLEFMVRYPRSWLYTRLRHERAMAAKGKPVHPLVTVTGLAMKVSGEYLGLVAETLGQLYWIGRNCAHTNEFFEIEKAMLAETDALYYEQIAPASTMLAEPKVELQRWVVRSVYDRSVLGIPQVGVTVEGRGTDITLQGLSGEQRHRLLKRYRQTQDVFDFLDGVLLYCARDPIEPGQPFFSSVAAVQEMRSTVSRELTKVALWLSGLMEGLDSGPPRAGTDTSDSAFLLRAVGLAVSDPETLRIRQDIVNHFLWSNKDNWESTPGPSLFGWLGTTLKRAWLRWVKDGTLDGDVWIDGKGHSHKGRQKQDLRGDKALDYIANRERIGARGARRPDCSDYDRDVESGHGFYEWAEASGELEEIETDEYRTAELQEIETAQRLVSISDGDLTNEGNQEIAVTRRWWRNLWLYKRPSSLDLGDFEKWIDPEIDIQWTVDDVYEVTKASPVLLDQAPTTAAYQPNGFVRIASKRADEMPMSSLCGPAKMQTTATFPSFLDSPQKRSQRQ